MRTTSRQAALYSLALLGCSSLVNPDVGRLGDAVDAGRAPLTDAAVDAGRPDVCSGAPSCRADVQITCVSGAEVETDCRFERAYCDESSARCVPWRCEPGAARCVGADTLIECDPRGIATSETICPRGCTEVGGEARCDDEPRACSGIATLTPGRAEIFDLCAEVDQASPVAGGDCEAGAGADRTFAFTLREERDVHLELHDWDWDGLTEIDTVLYLRTTCDQPSTQLACSDDTDCIDSDIPDCFIGTEYRISRLSLRLGPGTYYVVADSYRWSSTSTLYECGTVRLSLEI